MAAFLYLKRKIKNKIMTDITLKVDNGYFNYRVGAIIIHDNKLLMVKNDNHCYYSVGGRVQFGETSRNAILREMYEETNVEFEIDRLAFIHENRFALDSMNNAPCHEIAFYYLMKPSDKTGKIKCRSVGMDGSKEFLHWLPLDKLSNYIIYPEFFKTHLQNLNGKVRHFITENNSTAYVN